MKGLVITGGEAPGPEALRKIAQGTDLLAAADSGLIACEEASLAPNWIVGDMDSLGSDSRLDKYPSERVIRYPAEKDFTDTELAIALLREKGCDEIWIAGGGGGRTDHLFAIFSLFERETPPDRWFTANEEIRCLREGRALSAELPPGSLVSVFPLGAGFRQTGGPQANGREAGPWQTNGWQTESSGLKWPLNSLAWERGGLGLSNVAERGPFEIRSKKGRFLVIMVPFSLI